MPVGLQRVGTRGHGIHSNKPELDPFPTKGSKASAAGVGRESLVVAKILQLVACATNHRTDLV
jgi:hypothetical protein